MYGAFRAVGIGPPIELGGRSFTVHGRTVRDYAVIESRMAKARGNPFDVFRWMLINGFSKEHIGQLFTKCRKGWWAVTMGELMQWLQTWEGRVLGLSLALRQDCGWVKRAVMKECERRGEGREFWWNTIQEAIDIANGEDELSALRWIIRETKADSPRINWENVFRILGEEPFYKSVSEIENMTLPQLQMFWGEKVQQVDEFEADARLSKFAESETKAAENLEAGRNWGAL